MRKLLALLLLLMAVPVLLPGQAAEPLGLSDLVSFQVLPAELPRAQLERLRNGELVQLPGDPFDDLLQKADSARNPPRLTEARYRARLVESSLEGTAEWKITNPSAGPAVLPVQPLGIAVRQTRWRGRGDAILGNLQGPLGLLVDQTGESILELGWSARSSAVTGGLRFTLDVPPSAIGLLELELPNDRAILVSRDAFHLTGPSPAPTANHQLWKIGFSGRTQISLTIRRTTGPGLPPPLILARLQTKQTLNPGELEADFDFELEVLHWGVTKLVCECDPGLRPFQVSMRNLESWALKPGKTPTAASQLHIRLREPFQGGGLHIKCLASLTPGASWTAPGIRLIDAVIRDESLTLHVDPEIQLEDWQPGGFRLLRSHLDPKGPQVIQLAAGTEAGPNPPRPKAKLVLPGPEYGVRQWTWWELAPEQQKLTARLAYEVLRGRVFRLPLQLPPGWEVEQVDVVPTDRLGHWTVIPDKVKPLLMVELQRSLDPAASARLTVRLRRDPAAAGVIPFPDVVPLGARQRNGALGISLSSAYQASASASVPSVPGGGDELTSPRPPWGKQTLEYLYPFQGRVVEGSLNLRSRQSQVRAVCGQDVAIAAGRALLMTRLELHPQVGAPRQVELFISGPDAGRWDWRTVSGGNQVERMERVEAVAALPHLALLGARNSWQAATLASLPRPRGSYWRLVLARPLTETLYLESRQELAGRASTAALALHFAVLASRRPLDVLCLDPAVSELAEAKLQRRVWPVPLLCVPGAERMDGTATLHLTGSDLIQVEAQGLREVASPRSGGSLSPGQATVPWRSYRYSQLPAALTLRSGSATVDRSREAVIDAATLTSYLEPGGRVLHHFRFRIRDWRQQTIPIRLPGSVQLLAARGDGTWVLRLPPPSSHGDLVEFEFPVPGSAVPLHYELLYSTPASSFSLWQHLDAPVPQLPVEPMALERTWCLPPGVIPLSAAGLQSLPGGVTGRRRFPSILPRLAPGADNADWLPNQEQVVTDAILAIRKEIRPGESWTLGQVLERLAIDHMKDRATLIVDMEALAERGVQATDVLPAAAWDAKGKPWSPASFPLPVPWESLGLVYVPCSAAPLLTTRTQQLAWQNEPEILAADSPLALAIADAARYGQDRSGRFRRVVEWLEQGPSRALAALDQSHLVSEGLDEGWTEWVPLPGAARPNSLTVIRPGPLPAVGIMLGILLAFAAIRLGPQPGRRRFRLYLIWLALGGLGLLWLPATLRPLAWGPALVGMAVGLIWCARTALGLRRAAAATAATALLGIILAGSRLPAADSLPIVYRLPATDQRPAQVLAPPALIGQLQKLAQDAGLQGVRILAAEYQGKVEGSQVVFEARFRLHSFADEPAALMLPLSGIQLTDASLDDRPAQPIAQEGGFSLRIADRGEHRLVLRFTVNLPAPGDERDLRIGIPEIPQSRFLLEAPPSSSYLHVVDAKGSQRVSGGDKQALRLEADLGAVASVRVRWRQEEKRGKPPLIQVREAYYWDLKATSARLLTVLHYTVSQGWFTRVAIELPRDLEVASVEVGSVPNGPPAPRLKDWSLRPDGDKRRMEIEFVGPVTASVQVTLELVPRQPLGRSADLPFPTPLDGQSTRGFLAYRLEDLEAPSGPEKALAITGMRKEEQDSAFQEWFAIPWGLARQEKLLRPQRFFWRMRGGVLQLALQPPALPVTCRQQVSWQVESRQATLRAQAQLSTAEPRLALVQWEVPAALVVADVSGPQLAQWARSGNRIQAWLHKPAAEVNLQMTGWLPRAAKAPPRFDIPLVRILDVGPNQTTLRVSAGDGLTLTPGPLSNLAGQAALDSPAKDWQFTSQSDTYGGSFGLAAASANAYFHLLTFVEVRDRHLTFETTIECSVHRGELRRLALSLRNWEGGDIKLSAGAGKVEERKLGNGGRVWLVDLPPGVFRQYSLKLRGQLPLESVLDVRMPDVRVETTDAEPAPQERWLGVAGNDLEALGAAGLETVADPGTALRAWPREADRLRRTGGSAWKVLAPDWQLRLAPRGTLASSSIQCFLVEYEAAASDRQHWLHRATYWLAHEGGADLGLGWREGARILSVRVNGVPVPPLLQPDSQRLWLPLVGRAGPQTVEVVWTFAAGQERIDQPILDPPVLEGVSAGPVVWSIQIPAGYQWRRGPKEAGSARPSHAASLDLSRAEAQLRLMSWLADRAAGADPALATAFAAADQGFNRNLRFAEYRLALADESADSGGSIASWLRDLRQQHAELIRQPTLQPLKTSLREGADRAAQVYDLAPFEEGWPAYWYGPPGSGVPQFRLVSEESLQLRQTITLSVLLIALLFAAWVLASIFGAAAWPEQLGLLGALGWLVFGGAVGLAFLALPAAWFGIRLVQLGYLAWQALPRRSEAAAPTG